jgi:hypothetical protein
MTLNLVRGSADRLTMRYIPLLAWLFIALTIYGLGTMIAAVANGSRVLDAGTAFALMILAALALIAAATAGQLVDCRFDRRADEVRISRYGLRGRIVQTRRLSEVVGLEVRVLRRAQHRVELRLRSGERLPLTPYYVVALSGGSIGRLGALIGVTPVVVQQRAGLRP